MATFSIKDYNKLSAAQKQKYKAAKKRGMTSAQALTHAKREETSPQQAVARSGKRGNQKSLTYYNKLSAAQKRKYQAAKKRGETSAQALIHAKREGLSPRQALARTGKRGDHKSLETLAEELSFIESAISLASSAEEKKELRKIRDHIRMKINSNPLSLKLRPTVFGTLVKTPKKKTPKKKAAKKKPTKRKPASLAGASFALPGGPVLATLEEELSFIESAIALASAAEKKQLRKLRDQLRRRIAAKSQKKPAAKKKAAKKKTAKKKTTKRKTAKRKTAKRKTAKRKTVRRTTRQSCFTQAELAQIRALTRRLEKMACIKPGDSAAVRRHKKSAKAALRKQLAQLRTAAACRLGQQRARKAGQKLRKKCPAPPRTIRKSAKVLGYQRAKLAGQKSPSARQLTNMFLKS